MPGVVLLAVALIADERAGEPLAILGSMATTVGMLLFYQNLTGYWASWAYAWALVAPTSVGVGLFLYGSVRGRADKASEGLRMARVGSVMFLIGAIFFELVPGIGGSGLGRWGWPIALIAFGVILLARRLMGPGRNRQIKIQEIEFDTEG